MGKQRAPAESLSVVQARIAAANLVISLKGQWQAAVKAYDQEITDTKQYVEELSQQLVYYYGSTSPATLSSYGLQVKKERVPLTATEKVVAVVKGQATRVERGTRSKKATQAIKGKVPATVTIAVQTGTVTTTAPAPAAPPAVTLGATSAPGTGNGGTHT
jgi:lipopolysaccharide biosynthesis regulator YciM